MRYQFTYRMTAADLWKLSMYHIYGSVAGVCNLIFTAGMLALIVTFFGQVEVWWRVLLVVGFLLFPVVQPLAVYLKAKKQASFMTEDTRLSFLDRAILVEVGGKSQEIKWEAVRKIAKKPGMIVIFSDTTHGFVLTNRVLGEEREDFYRFIAAKIKQR